MQTDVITTYNPLYHAVMKLAHGTGLGEGFVAALLGAKGLATTFYTLAAMSPFNAQANPIAAVAGTLGMMPTGGDCRLQVASVVRVS